MAAEGSPAGESPRRVLHLIKSMSVVGGAEQLLLSLTVASSSRAWEYHVAHVLPHPSEHLVEGLHKAGVTVHSLGVDSHYDPRWLRRLRTLILEKEIDVLHVHLPYAASLGRLVARSIPHGPAIVHTQHNLWRHNVAVVRLLHRATYRLDDADIAVSNAAWEALPSRLQARTEVLVHGLALGELDQLGDVRDEVHGEVGAEPDEVLVTTVANMRREKGYEVLLEAVRILVGEGARLRLAAVGSGPLEEDVRRWTEELGLGRHVVLTGYRSDARRIVAGSDIFVLASHHEGFPVAVMEAIALGVPVVSTAVGDVPLVVGKAGCGVIVPSGDAVALAAAMRSLVEDPVRRATMAAAARSTGAQFDIRRVAGRLEEIYAEVYTARPVGHGRAQRG